MTDAANPHAYQTLSHHYLQLPHCQAIGLRFESALDRSQTLSVDWRDDLVGNQATQVLHGGVITTLVDVASATAVAAHLPDFETLATLDMRIDYLHAATPQQRVFATSDCYRLSGQVAFVRTMCYQEHDQNNPIALGTATFMRSPIPAHLKELIK